MLSLRVCKSGFCGIDRKTLAYDLPWEAACRSIGLIGLDFRGPDGNSPATQGLWEDWQT